MVLDQVLGLQDKESSSVIQAFIYSFDRPTDRPTTHQLVLTLSASISAFRMAFSSLSSLAISSISPRISSSRVLQNAILSGGRVRDSMREWAEFLPMTCGKQTTKGQAMHCLVSRLADHSRTRSPVVSHSQPSTLSIL